MPVIRGERTEPSFPPAARDALLERLRRELAGERSEGGPFIFQIPLPQSDRDDVLVVWDEWESVRSEDRTEIILEAYGPQQDSIAQALGVTYQEAVEQHLLPYGVSPMARRDEIEPHKLRQAMTEAGAFVLPDGAVDLRFPTRSMAEAAHRKLCKEMPGGYWTIAEAVGPGGWGRDL